MQQQQRAAQRPPAEPLPANNAATGTGSTTLHTQFSELKLFCSVVDPHQGDADPDPTYHFGRDPDPDFSFMRTRRRIRINHTK